jgi:DNA ligase (NAD+)
MLAETFAMLRRDPKTLQRRDIVVLREMVQFHRHQYYELENPLISDSEFDSLYALLVATENLYNEHHEESPSQKIDTLVDNHFTKAPHFHPMTSLDNTYDANDLREFEIRIVRILEKVQTVQRIEYVVEYKFDGLGIALTYE